MMLTKPMKKFVLSKDKSGYTNATQRIYEKRIMEYSLNAIKDLTLIAQSLDDSVHTQIFNDKTLMPFLKAIFHVGYKEKITKEEREDRRKRILNLCFELLFYLGSRPTAWDIAPNAIRMLQNQIPDGIHALLMEPR